MKFKIVNISCPKKDQQSVIDVMVEHGIDTYTVGAGSIHCLELDFKVAFPDTDQDRLVLALMGEEPDWLDYKTILLNKKV